MATFDSSSDTSVTSEDMDCRRDEVEVNPPWELQKRGLAYLEEEIAEENIRRNKLMCQKYNDLVKMYEEGTRTLHNPKREIRRMSYNTHDRQDIRHNPERWREIRRISFNTQDGQDIRASVQEDEQAELEAKVAEAEHRSSTQSVKFSYGLSSTLPKVRGYRCVSEGQTWVSPPSTSRVSDSLSSASASLSSTLINHQRKKTGLGPIATDTHNRAGGWLSQGKGLMWQTLHEQLPSHPISRGGISQQNSGYLQSSNAYNNLNSVSCFLPSPITLPTYQPSQPRQQCLYQKLLMPAAINQNIGDLGSHLHPQLSHPQRPQPIIQQRGLFTRIHVLPLSALPSESRIVYQAFSVRKA